MNMVSKEFYNKYIPRTYTTLLRREVTIAKKLNQGIPLEVLAGKCFPIFIARYAKQGPFYPISRSKDFDWCQDLSTS